MPILKKVGAKVSECYDAKLCEEKHKRTDERLNTQDTRLNNHAERLDKLEQRASAVDTKIENLCDKIESLVGTLKWGFGIFVTIALFIMGYLIKIK